MTRQRLPRLVLRTLAVLIAVAAAIDPVMTVTRPAARSVVLASLASADVADVESAVRSALPAADVSLRRATNGRLPCLPGEPCLMVADGSVDVDIPTDLDGPVSLITMSAAAGPNVAVQAVIAPAMHHAAGSGTARVVMTGTGMQGRRTDVRISDGAATVGSVSHEWAAGGEAAVDVPWWPLGEGARSLRVTAVPFDGEQSTADNAVEVGVNVASIRAQVLVFDARPSWASTFVRRAIEDDARFRVDHRVGLGPALAAGTPGARLDRRSLEAASVVIVGSPESVTAGDVTLLEQFARTRGGTLILLPDRAPGGASARLFQGRWTEHLEATASPAGSLRASETLRLLSPTPFDTVLAAVKGAAVVVLSPAGNGRIVVSGALDAWRYRDADGGAFDRFWRSLVLESAAAGVPLRLEFASAIARPGAEVPLVVRHRRMDEAVASSIAGTVTCGAQAARALRLWPAGGDGVFTGRVIVDGDGPCEVRVTIEGGPSAVAGIAVTNGATQGAGAVMSKLEREARRTGGVVVPAGDAAAISTALVMPAPDQPEPVHPMRSPWWMFPFVTCLGVEWWLRRRGGVR